MRIPFRVYCAALACAVQGASAFAAGKSLSPCADVFDDMYHGQDAAFHRVLVITDEDFSSEEDCVQLGGYIFETQSIQGRQLDYNLAAAIVDRTWRPAAKDNSERWITALLDWLEQAGFEEFSRDLAEFIDSNLPETKSLELFFTVLLWFIVTATFLMILREFYIAGLLRFPGSRRVEQAQIDDPVAGIPSWQYVTGLPLREQMAALLRFSIDTLVMRKKLPAGRGYTNREYLRFLANRGASEADPLRLQVDLTEPVIYGDAKVSRAHVDACRNACWQLAGGFDAGQNGA